MAAERGTLKGEAQRGWRRFWALPWIKKGPLLALVVIVCAAAIGNLAGGSDDTNKASAAPGTPVATAKASSAPGPTSRKDVTDAFDTAVSNFNTFFSTWQKEVPPILGGIDAPTHFAKLHGSADGYLGFLTPQAQRADAFTTSPGTEAAIVAVRLAVTDLKTAATAIAAACQANDTRALGDAADVLLKGRAELDAARKAVDAMNAAS
jgi:hypothetical protein